MVMDLEEFVANVYLNPPSWEKRINDNLTSVLLAGPAVLPLAKFNFDN